MKKFRKYLFRAFAVVFGLFLLLMIIVFIYVSANKKKIIRQVTSELSKKINGNVTVGNVELSFFRNFPTVSVLLHDVKVTDTMFAVHKHPFLQAEEIFAQLSVKKLFQKQSPLKGIKLINGTLYIYSDSSGYSNDYLLKQKSDAPATVKESGGQNALTSVQLKSFRVIIDDRRREKLHDLVIKRMEVDLDDRDAIASFFSVDAEILVHSLAFNLPRGSFLKEKTFRGDFNLRFDKKLKQLQFDSIDVKIQGQPFNMSGRFDLAGTIPQFKFAVHTKDIIYDQAKAMLPQKIATSLSLVNIQNPIDADAIIIGPLKGGEPLINISWKAKEVRLATPFLDFDEAGFTGSFTNEFIPGMPRKDANSRILINNFKALWHDIPVTASNIEILNLTTPTLTCDLHSGFPLATLNSLIGAGSLEFTSGDAAFDMTYKGPIQKNDNSNSFLNGNITFKNGTLLYTPRIVEMKNVNATLVFKNSDVIIENLQTVVLNNAFTMKGEAKNLLTLINTGPNNVLIDWNIYSPALNLDAFTFLLGTRKKVTAKTNKKSIANVSSKIDAILEEGKLNVQLKTNKLVYRKFEAENVSANILLLSDRYLINNVSMNHAGGKMNLNGSMVSSQHNNLTSLNMTIANVDVSRLFRAFENFGQDGITDASLEGKLTAKVRATLGISEAGKVNPSSLEGVVDFSLKDGALNNYEPVKKLQRFVFKKRDFDNIRFAELKNRFDIKNREITINRMEIQSSVLSMFVEGIYSLKGNTDISIQVPLNNLKKRDSTYNPENIGIGTKTGKSVFVRGRPGSDGNIKFGLDLFNKYGKAKKNKKD